MIARHDIDKFVKAVLFAALICPIFSGWAHAADQDQLCGAKSPSDYQKAVDLAESATKLMQQGNTDESIRTIAEAQRLAPQQPAIEDRFAYILSHSGKTSEAIEHEKRAVALAPNDPELWRNLGLTYHDLGDETSAAKALQKFVYIAPSHPEAERARKFIERYQAMAEIAKDDNATDYFNAATRGQLYWWHKNGKPIKVFVSSKGCPDPKLLEIVRVGFDDWSKASNQIFFQFVSDPKNADMQILWTDDVKQVHDSSEGGEARCEYTDDRIDKSQVTFLTTRMIMHGQLMPEKAHWFALHEIGHALGLLGHSPNHEDIMYWACPGTFTEVKLSPRDIETMRMLYSSTNGEKK
jgi:tetratricopeptide (TPR) repeat protein